MVKDLVVALACFIGIFQANAVIAGDFTASQRAEIIQIVREALKSDPSILGDAVEALQSDQSARQAEAAGKAIKADHDALYHQSDPVAGDDKGDLTIVEFLDPRCPYCRHLAPALAAFLQHDHGTRVIFKDMPVLGPPSMLASRALLAADRQGGYERLLTAVMGGGPDITETSLRDQAIQVGLDWARLQRDMADPAIQRRLDDNIQLGKRLGIEGTPTFVVGERLVAGSDLGDVQAAVAAVRAERRQSGAASRQ